jgi:hypothetical protein
MEGPRAWDTIGSLARLPGRIANMTWIAARTPILLLGSLLALLAGACGSSAPVEDPSPDRTGIPHIDRIIEAALSDDGEALQALVSYATLPCTEAEGFGGPPKCAAGESEGTPVEVLPVLGSEGHHLRREQVAGWQGIPEANLVAVYRVGTEGYADPYFPRGDTALAFLQAGHPGMVILQVTSEGIVRLDYSFESPEAGLPGVDADAFLLGPFVPGE